MYIVSKNLIEKTKEFPKCAMEMFDNCKKRINIFGQQYLGGVQVLDF